MPISAASTVRAIAKPFKAVASETKQLATDAHEKLDAFVDKVTPAPFRRGDGPKIDVFNASKDWMSDRVFNKLKPSGPPEKLQGAQRVAYGPLDAPPTLKRPAYSPPRAPSLASSTARFSPSMAPSIKS